MLTLRSWASPLALLAATVVFAAGDQARSNEKLMAYGKHLSQECTSCHSREGEAKGIPPILGLPPDDFVATMQFYQSGARPNPVMVSVAKSLDDEQLKALALYFGSLKPPPKVPPASPPTPNQK